MKVNCLATKRQQCLYVRFYRVPTYCHNDVSVLNTSFGYLIKNYQDCIFLRPKSIIHSKYLSRFTATLK
jgi:hypothetical protein